MYNSKSTFCYNRIPFWSHGFLLLLSRNQSEVWTYIYILWLCVYIRITARELIDSCKQNNVFMVTFIFINVLQKTLEWSNVTIMLGGKSSLIPKTRWGHFSIDDGRQLISTSKLSFYYYAGERSKPRYKLQQWHSQAGAHWGTCPSKWRLCPTSAGAPENYRCRMYHYQSRIGR